MDVVSAPTDTDNVNIFWLKTHTLDGSSSTIPPQHDDIIATGAAGYAALDRGAFAADRVNTGGDDVWGRYKAFGDERLREFRRQLAAFTTQRRLRQRKLYVADTPSVFEQSRVKYVS
jgi:hypothetical protein